MKTLVEAVNEALHQELERDPKVLVMGEDVGVLEALPGYGRPA